MSQQTVELRRNITKNNFFLNNIPGFVLVRQKVFSDPQLHAHDFHELVIVLAGSGFHVSQQGKFAINRGDVFLTLPGVAHSCQDCVGLEIAVFMFYPDLTGFSFEPLRDTPAFQTFFQTTPHLADSFRFRNKFFLDSDSLTSINHLLKQIELEQSAKRPDWCFAANSLFMHLLLLLLRLVFQNRQEEYRELLLMNQILQFINANYMNRISSGTLAKKFALSERTLERIFKKMLNTTPCSYIGELRLCKSQEFLEDFKYSITEVAYNAGFTDNCYFSKCFSVRFGESPRAYRNRFRKN